MGSAPRNQQSSMPCILPLSIAAHSCAVTQSAPLLSLSATVLRVSEPARQCSIQRTRVSVCSTRRSLKPPSILQTPASSRASRAPPSAALSPGQNWRHSLVHIQKIVPSITIPSSTPPPGSHHPLRLHKFVIYCIVSTLLKQNSSSHLSSISCTRQNRFSRSVLRGCSITSREKVIIDAITSARWEYHQK